MNHPAVQSALAWLEKNKIALPLDVRNGLQAKGYAIKQGDSVDAINAEYHDAITGALVDYFENGGAVTSYKNEFKRAMSDAFVNAFELGWQDGGQELPLDDDALDWLGARQSQELGFIDMLFAEAKQLRKEEDFDYFTWATARADGYVNTLKEVYNNAKLRAAKDIMVTFDGDDGKESCADCQKYKGQRHRISWFISRNAVPPFGNGLECHKGGKCQHGLRNDKGEWMTI